MKKALTEGQTLSNVKGNVKPFDNNLKPIAPPPAPLPKKK